MQTFHKMCGDRVFPVMKTYNSVMNTLSKYGHGDLVAHVLTCIRNKEWVSSGMYIHNNCGGPLLHDVD